MANAPVSEYSTGPVADCGEYLIRTRKGTAWGRFRLVIDEGGTAHELRKVCLETMLGQTPQDVSVNSRPAVIDKNWPINRAEFDARTELLIL